MLRELARCDFLFTAGLVGKMKPVVSKKLVKQAEHEFVERERDWRRQIGVGNAGYNRDGVGLCCVCRSRALNLANYLFKKSVNPPFSFIFRKKKKGRGFLIHDWRYFWKECNLES